MIGRLFFEGGGGSVLSQPPPVALDGGLRKEPQGLQPRNPMSVGATGEEITSIGEESSKKEGLQIAVCGRPMLDREL